jgi:hypothetical protein
MDDHRRNWPAADPGTVNQLLGQALSLARETRDHLLAEPASASRSSLDALIRAATFGRITTRLTASIAWLLACRAVAAGELDPKAARDSRWRLLAVPDHADDPLPADDPKLARLARDSAALYARLQRLDAALDSDPATRH